MPFLIALSLDFTHFRTPNRDTLWLEMLSPHVLPHPYFSTQRTDEAWKYPQALLAPISSLAYRRVQILTRFQFCKSYVGVLRGHMQSRGLIFFPGVQCILMDLLALLLAFDILFYRFAQQPMGAALTFERQLLHSLLDFTVELYTRSRLHEEYSPVLPFKTLPSSRPIVTVPPAAQSCNHHRFTNIVSAKSSMK
ncbi:hypothetical protein [Agrobacterium vitis]|uniref:hypothetical protein n=1 Tax=Agrobacterium vitis TaxID=373 RepID=UPI003BABB416